MKTAIVAGHICLDIIPSMPDVHADLLAPGRLLQMGPATVCTGGPVSNTGLALHKLGVPVSLMGKTGSDPLGAALRAVLESFAPALSGGIIATPEAGTSYSVILSPPGVDRTFWHYPGANDTFCADDIDYARVATADLFHFGYPPIMQRIFSERGAELVEIFRQVKAAGVTTSLDMCFPDPNSQAGRTDWRAFFKLVLPYVDIFLPSIDELMFMLRREEFDRINAKGQFIQHFPVSLLSELSAELLEMGANVVVLKLGSRGVYLRTGSVDKIARIGKAAPVRPAEWGNVELHSPCFRVDVVGTTGSGDATIAGFLAALLRDFDPVGAVSMAVAVGACNVEAADALSGIRSWDETLARVDAGWEKLVVASWPEANAATS